MRVKIGLDIGSGFITATVIEMKGDKYQRKNVFVEEAIPSTIVANRDRITDILFGLAAADKLNDMRTTRRRYYKTSAPIKTIMRQTVNWDTELVKINYPSDTGTQIGKISNVVEGLLKYIKEEILRGYKDLGYDISDVQIDMVGIAYPNQRDIASINYSSKLKEIVKKVFSVDEEHIIVNEEAYYIGFLLNNMGILDSNEVGMIIDVGAGTTDIAVVQSGNPGNIIERGSYDFGGSIADNIIEKKWRDTLKDVSPQGMINTKKWLFNISGDGVTSGAIDSDDSKEEVLSTEFNSNGTRIYATKLSGLCETIGNIINKKIGEISSGLNKNRFRIVFTGGSCNLPHVIDSVREKVSQVFRRNDVDAKIETIILDQYKKNDSETQTEAKKRNIDNETFMSYAVALDMELSSSGAGAHESEVAATTTEHEEQTQQVNEEALIVCSHIRPVECGAPYILATLVHRLRPERDQNGQIKRDQNGQIINQGEDCFYKLTTFDPMLGRCSVVSQGKYSTMRGDEYYGHFIGIQNGLYHLMPKSPNDVRDQESSKAQKDGTDYKVYNLRRNERGVIEIVEDKGQTYEVVNIKDENIKDAFKPKYKGGKAVVEINNSEITNSEQATNGAGFAYDVEFTYDYSGSTSQGKKITVKYKGDNWDPNTNN